MIIINWTSLICKIKVIWMILLLLLLSYIGISICLYIFYATIVIGTYIYYIPIVVNKFFLIQFIAKFTNHIFQAWTILTYFPWRISYYIIICYLLGQFSSIIFRISCWWALWCGFKCKFWTIISIIIICVRVLI